MVGKAARTLKSEARREQWELATIGMVSEINQRKTAMSISVSLLTIVLC